MAFNDTITLKGTSDEDVNYVKVASESNKESLRIATGTTAPDSWALALRPKTSSRSYQSTSDNKGRKVNVQTRNASIRKNVDDAAGDMHAFTASLSLIYPEVSVVSFAALCGSIHELVSLFVTGTFSLNTTNIEKLMRGEI